MVPGPVSVPKEILEAGMQNYGSADVEKEFFDLYFDTEAKLQDILGTKNTIIIHTGEGMLALWGAMKSTLKQGDKVLAISTGLFGHGMGSMAESIGCEVRTIDYGFDESIHDYGLLERAIKDFNPKMITMVQNETPSGTLNSVDVVGELKRKYNIPLLYVDAVSGLGGSYIDTDENSIDLCLGGSQKCLSAPPNMAFFSVSDKAWEIAQEVAYNGYDALLPFKEIKETGLFPYTPYWQGMAQLNKACDMILTEGLDNVIKRHEEVAEYCRKRVIDMGLKLYPVEDAVKSPTVTAIVVPDEFSWDEFDGLLREKGLVVGGNYGCLAGEVFRIGHMGSQAKMDLVKSAMDIIEEVLKSK